MPAAAGSEYLTSTSFALLRSFWRDTSVMSEPVPLKHIVDPGEYSCQLWVPIEGEEKRALEASISLQPRKQPKGDLFGDVPIHVEVNEHGSSAAFPQSYEFPIVEGRLRSNHVIWLIDVNVQTWPGDRALFDARCALVGFPSSEPKNLFQSIRVQTTYLDRMASFAPIARFKPPQRTDGQPIEWWAEEASPMHHEWTSDNASLTLGFDCSARTGDPYEMSVRYSPVVTVELTKPVSLSRLVEEWIDPLQGIATVVMGSRAELTFVALEPAKDQDDDKTPSSRTKFMQLYGSGIVQAPFAAKKWSGNDKHAAVQFGLDSLSLLTLLESWQGHLKRRHPLYETYVSVLGVPDDHPRNRLLLLLQALEGHYGYERATQLRQRRKKFSTDMAEHVAALEASDIPQASKRFLKKNVRHSPPQGLDEALRWAVKPLPDGLEKRLSDCELLNQVIDEDQKLTHWADALRTIRNDLAHGNRGFDAFEMHQVVKELDLVVRAQVLLTLGAPDEFLEGLLDDGR